MQIAKSWRRQPSHLRFEGTKCPKCSNLMFPISIVCDKCKNKELETFTFSGKAILVAKTVVYEALREFSNQVPYIAGLVKLEEGIVIPAMITDIDPQDIFIGMSLEMVTRKIGAQGDEGPILYAYKFAPVF